MWFALDQPERDGDGVEQVLPRLAAVLRYSQDLEQRLAASGVDGITGALALYRCLRTTLGELSDEEVERMLGETAALERALSELARSLREISRLKDLVDSAEHLETENRRSG